MSRLQELIRLRAQVESDITHELLSLARVERARPEVPARVAPATVRAWARANGYTVGSRGAIKPAVQAAYDAAHASGGPR